MTGLAGPRTVELPHPQRYAVSKNGMVASQHWAASEAGAAMFAAGGNAIDAAVATAFALGVCEPAASGLGGQTMLLVYLADLRKTIAIDGSSRAPNRATPGKLDAAQRRRGHASTTVPSTPAVLDYVLKTYGKLKLAKVLQPAIDLADKGFGVSQLLHDLTKRELVNLRDTSAADCFLSSGEPYAVGERLQQPLLAETLSRLSSKGIRDFYRGQIAKDIAADMRKNGGLLHRDDLAQVPVPIERRPLATRFGSMRLMTMPPPGAGRTLVEMLNILSHVTDGRRLPDTPLGAATMAEVIRRAFLDRRDRPYDPNLWAQVAEPRMLTDEYAKIVSGQVKKRVRVHGETTHLSTADAAGNFVALTQSIERVYGSCVVTPSLGFLFNDYMSAFEYDDFSHPYYLRPNAVPWASVAPTIVFKGRRPWLAIGSPGSERIVPSIVQVILRLATQSPMEAVSAPRLYCDLNGRVSLEASRMRSDIPGYLERLGFTVNPRDPFAFYMGCVQLVLRERDRLIGVADLRRDGAAVGA